MGIFSLPENRKPNELMKKPNPKKLTHLADIRIVALTERQQFIEELYYRNSPISIGKPLTEPMKRLVTDSLDLCLQAPPEKRSAVKIKTGRLLPTVSEWQAIKSPDLNFEEFKKVLAKELDLSEMDNRILLHEYLIRIAKQYSQSVRVQDYVDLNNRAVLEAAAYSVSPPKSNIEEPENSRKAKAQEDYTSDEKILYKDTVFRVYQVRRLLDQMNRFGIERIVKHYEQIQEIERAFFPKDLDITINSIYNKYPRVAKALANVPLETANANNLDELSKDIFYAIKEKRLFIKIQGLEHDQYKATFDQELSSGILSNRFETAYRNLISLIPQEDRHFFDESPYYVLKIAMALRKILPVANTEVLAQIWWQLRLGGTRAKDIYTHAKKELPKFVKKQRLEKYTRHLADNYLGSEASSYEFQNEIKIPELTAPNKILFQTIKNLIRNHIPKGQKTIRLTLLDGENNIRKLSVGYHEGILDSEIEMNIGIALTTNNWKKIELEERERAKLSYIGLNSSKRKRDKNYKKIYQNFAQKKENKEEYDGDYLIQVGADYEDSRDPRSLFAVDSHKAAVQLKFKEAGKVLVTTRYNHQYFDGEPAKLHTNSLVEEIKKSKAASGSKLLLPSNKPTIDYLRDNLVERNDNRDLPLVEARADYDDEEIYASETIDNITHLTSTELRSLMIARANGVGYFQLLVRCKQRNESYFVRNPNSDNIQPIVVAPVILKRENRIIWTKNLRDSSNRAKGAIGDVALFGAIAGTKEAPLTYAGSILNPTLINMLSHTQGMVSPLIGNGNFTTAFSNANRPATINLNKPLPSMGVIGMMIDKKQVSHYSVRLLPSQAQNQFRVAALKLCSKKLDPKNQQKFLLEFTKIIKSWNRLVSGEGNRSQISLEEYERERDYVFKKLANEGFIDLKGKVTDGKTLQIYLNETLKEAAKSIFDSQKLKKAREELISLIKN